MNLAPCRLEGDGPRRVADRPSSSDCELGRDRNSMAGC